MTEASDEMMRELGEMIMQLCITNGASPRQMVRLNTTMSCFLMLSMRKPGVTDEQLKDYLVKVVELEFDKAKDSPHPKKINDMVRKDMGDA